MFTNNISYIDNMYIDTKTILLSDHYPIHITIHPPITPTYILNNKLNKYIIPKPEHNNFF